MIAFDTATGARRWTEAPMVGAMAAIDPRSNLVWAQEEGSGSSRMLGYDLASGEPLAGARDVQYGAVCGAAHQSRWRHGCPGELRRGHDRGLVARRALRGRPAGCATRVDDGGEPVEPRWTVHRDRRSRRTPTARARRGARRRPETHRRSHRAGRQPHRRSAPTGSCSSSTHPTMSSSTIPTRARPVATPASHCRVAPQPRPCEVDERPSGSTTAAS